MLCCEVWTENLDTLLALVKESIIDLWEVRKVKLYGDPCSTQLQSQSSAGDPRDDTVVGRQRNGKFGKFSHSGRVAVSYVSLMICYVYVRVNLALPTFVGAWSRPSETGRQGQPEPPQGLTFELHLCARRRRSPR